MNVTEWWVEMDRLAHWGMSYHLSILWQSTVIFSVVWILAWLLRNQAPACRRALWLVALLVAPLLPVLTAVIGRMGIPRGSIDVFSWYSGAETVPPAVPPTGVPETVHAASAAHVLGAPGSARVVPRNGDPATSPAIGPESRTASRLSGASGSIPVSPGPHSRPDSVWSGLFAVYLAGVGIFLFWILLGRMRLLRWIRSSTPPADRRVQRVFGKICLGRWRVRVRESGRVPAPLSAGVFRPTILFPAGFTRGLCDGELLAISLHEAGHIRRRDPLFLTLGALIRGLLFFHPLVWFALRRFSIASEECADADVLEVTGEAVTYAKTLTRLAEMLPVRLRFSECATGILFERDSFFRRVQGILRPVSERRRLSGPALGATVSAVVCALFLAVAFPVSESRDLSPSGEVGSDARESVSQDSAIDRPATAQEAMPHNDDVPEYGDRPVEWKVTGGNEEAWRSVDGILTSGDGDAAGYLNPSYFFQSRREDFERRDYVVTARVRAHDENGSFTLLARFQDPHNYYGLEYRDRTWRERLRLVKVQNGDIKYEKTVGWGYGYDDRAVPEIRDREVEFRIEARANRIRGWVDDDYEMEFTDEDFPTGAVGLANFFYRVDVLEFDVRGLPAAKTEGEYADPFPG